MYQKDASPELTLHPDAAKNFNEIAESLVPKLKFRPPERRSRKKFQPDLYVSGTFTAKDMIGEVRLRWTDHLGNPTAQFFQQQNRFLGLFGESYQDLVRLAEGIHKIRTFSNAISKATLIDVIFDWLRDKHRKQSDLPMVDHILSKCRELVRPIEIWIPVAMLHVGSEIKIGKVTLKTITKDMFDRWRSENKVKARDRRNVQKFMEKQQKELQGFPAATIKLIAEPNRAFELAIEETEKSLAVIRFYSSASYLPRKTSYCAIRGKENLESIKHLVIEDGKLIRITQEGVDQAADPLLLDDKTISINRNDGLDLLSDLLSQQSLSEFQESLLDAITTYSKAALAKGIDDKLIYILVALESLLLKNENEPIQQNISERMAFVIGKGVDERRLIIKNAKATYGLRSRFIHHGQTVDDVKTLEEFMWNAWVCFVQLIKNANRFKSKKELIEAIEDLKLT